MNGIFQFLILRVRDARGYVSKISSTEEMSTTRGIVVSAASSRKADVDAGILFRRGLDLKRREAARIVGTVLPR